MARKYQIGGDMYSFSDSNFSVTNPNTVDLIKISPEEADYQSNLSIGDNIYNGQEISFDGKSTSTPSAASAGGYAGAIQAAGSLFGNINNMFNNKNSNEYVAYDDSWAGVISNSNRRRQGLDAVNAQLEDYSGLNSVNDFFAIGGHLSGVKPLDDNNVAGSVGTAIASDAAQGAAIGTQIMPGWGTLIGAAVGTVSGATRGGIGAAQAKKNVGYLNNAIDRVNYMNDINRDNQISTIMNRNIRSTFPYGGNLFQYGGEIDPAMLQQLMAQQGQPQDFGDTGNGVTTFDEGGTHEENPNGGIPQGVAPDGEPNLVEENEVKYKDYIYSDRLVASKTLLKEHNLPTKYAGKSFAKIADKLQEESKDRPNDEISKSTLDDMMSRLEEAQEEYKAQKEVEDKASQIDNMAPEEKAALLDQIQMMGQQQPAYGMQMPQGMEPMMQQQGMAPEEAAMMQQPQMSPEEEALLAQQQSQQFACGGKKYQYGGNIPIGTRQAGGYSYAPFYDQYEAWLASQPIIQPQSIGYTYQPSATELELNATVNAIKEDQAKQDFYNRWVGTGKDKKGKYWYYTNHPETKYYEEKPTLAEVDATVADMGYADTYAEGGDIYIKPSKRGTFTAAAKKHGKSVQAFASQVLANKENYSPAMVRKANFARNAASWKHQEGGLLTYPNPTKEENFFNALNMAGPFVGAATSMLQPVDYEYANDLTKLSRNITPHTVPNIQYEGQYEPMDINNPLNLVAAQNAAAQLASQQGGTRATTAAQRIALQNAYIAQQNDLANRLALSNYERKKALADKAVEVANMNAAINEKNAAYLTDAESRRLALLNAAAQAREESRTARAKSISDTQTNMFTESGKMRQQEFNNRMYLNYLEQQALKNALENTNKPVDNITLDYLKAMNTTINPSDNINWGFGLKKPWDMQY